ncbi:hypothetical protein GCM10020331_060660 [Ectobacillus funiculus]
MTTASMVWAASALGIAVGAGFFYLEAVVAMLLIILAINVFPFVIKRVGPSSLRQKDLSLKLIVNESQDLNEIFLSKSRNYISR